MWKLIFNTPISEADDMSLEAFKTEGQWLKDKREQLIKADKDGAKMMLINNPKREVTLNKPTVLIGRYN